MKSLFLLIILLTGCSKEPNEMSDRKLERLLTRENWEVIGVSDLQVSSLSFASVRIAFGEGGVMEMSDGGNSGRGMYTLSKASGGEINLAISTPVTSSAALNYFIRNWIITHISRTSLSLTDVFDRSIYVDLGN